MSIPKPNIAKDLGNGQFLCVICSQQIKAKIWVAHTNGRKHRENLFKLKDVAASKRSNKAIDDENDETLPKRSKNENESNEKSSSDVTTPWHAEAKMRSLPSNDISTLPKNVIEGVPEGFFDDKAKNSRVKDTIDKQRILDKEYDRFMKELAEVEVEKEEADDIEEESSAIQNDIETINEHIKLWKSVEELEKKKDGLLSSMRNEPSKIIDESISSESDIEEFDVDSVDWRAKKIT